MREDHPRNLKEMSAEVKNTSEFLMVDLACAALFYNSKNLSNEEKIGNAGARALVKRFGVSSDLLRDLPAAEETISRGRIGTGSDLDGLEDLDLPVAPDKVRTLKALRLETWTGIYVLAANRDGRWTYRPHDASVLKGGASLFATGAPEGLKSLTEEIGRELEEI